MIIQKIRTQNNWMEEARIAYQSFQSTMKAQGMTDLREDALSYIKESDPALGNQEDWIRDQFVEPEQSDLYRKLLNSDQGLTYRSALMYSLFICIASHTDF